MLFLVNKSLFPPLFLRCNQCHRKTWHIFSEAFQIFIKTTKASIMTTFLAILTPIILLVFLQFCNKLYSYVCHILTKIYEKKMLHHRGNIIHIRATLPKPRSRLIHFAHITWQPNTYIITLSTRIFKPRRITPRDFFILSSDKIRS